MEANAIREILKVVSQPGMISLAGGIPAAESFPLDIIRELTDVVLDKYGPKALQYDATEGFRPLRETLADYLRTKDVTASPDDVLVFSGSQNVLDTVAKILITPGDHIVLEAPSYLGAISAFNPFEPGYISVETDDAGLIPDALEQILRANPVKFIYLVPTFQNPTGRTLLLERRRQVAELIQRYDVLLLEDDPYSALRYNGDPLPPIHKFAPEHVIYTSTLSKVLAPGLRIGFCVAPKPIARWLVIAKQGVDLHTNTFGQALAAEYLAGGYLANHLPKIIDLYRPLRDAMLNALEAYFPPGFTWSRPDGGMFLWVEGPAGLDGEGLYWKCVARKVAFVPGRFFYATDHALANATLRLNFTRLDEPTIDKAIRVIADAAYEPLVVPV
jgi:2-aminoadipate transaminase